MMNATIDLHRTATLMTLIPLLVPAALRADDELPLDVQLEARLRSELGEDALIKHTPHFVVVYEQESPILDEFTARLEHTYHGVRRFAELLELSIAEPDHKLEILFFHTEQNYLRHVARYGFQGAGTYGVYMDTLNRSFFYNVENDGTFLIMQQSIATSQESIDRLLRSINGIQGEGTPVRLELADGTRQTMTKSQARDKVNEARDALGRLRGRRERYIEHINRTVIQHETAHQVAFNFGLHARRADNPKWFVEGMACLLESPPSQAGGGFGILNQYRLEDLRAAIAPDHARRRITTQDFLDAVAAGRIISPQRLVSDSALFAQRGPQMSSVYACSWAMIHYLFRARRDEFAGYTRELQQRQPGRRFTPDQELTLFERYFGPIDDAFVKRWGSYLTRQPYTGPPGS